MQLFISNPNAGLFNLYLSYQQICVRKLIIIGSDNGLSPGRRQAIIRTNAGMLLIAALGQISVKS